MSNDMAITRFCSFLCDYACELIAMGASGLRIQRNIERMAGHAGCECLLDFSRSTANIQLTSREYHATAYCNKLVPHRGINFSKIRLLSSLSWDFADGLIDADTAYRRFEDIVKGKSLNGSVVRLLTCCANASFCELFGGDAISMAVVFAATYVGFWVKQFLLSKQMNVYIVFGISSLVAALLSSCVYIFHLGSTPDIAFGTSVLYLVPGIPYLNSVCDLVTGHQRLGLERIFDALNLTIALSLGLCGAMTIMNIA